MKKLLAALLALVLVISATGCQSSSTKVRDIEKDGTTGTTGSDSSTDTPKDETPKEGVYLKANYSVSDEYAINNRDTVVATVGDGKLTNAQLQIYYWTGVYSFLNEQGYYIYYYGLDLSKGLEEQKLPQEDSTWQQYFLSDALAVWHRYQALALKNDQLGLEMDPELQAQLDATEKDMTDQLENSDFKTMEEMLEKNMGAGITLEDYLEYSELFYRSYNYYLHMFNQIEISDEEAEAYFNEHEAELKEEGVTKETLGYDVRHILIVPESDDKDATTYTDAQWEACRVKAEALLNQWLANNPTEESFAQLAKEHSEDPGSAENGGMYEGLNEQTNFVEPFKAWYLDESKKVGDYGLVKSDYGYHIMYMSDIGTIWLDYCREIMEYDQSTIFVNAALEEFEMDADYENMALAVVTLQ